jgi:bifunctional UDP-N-acetylglucosamine pyrophosphorylase / glucosamine-1-phosphate N-acetyltransferase
MLDRLLDLYIDSVDRVVVIVHPSFADQVRAHGLVTGAPLSLEVQEKPTGMLDAILLGRQQVEQSDAVHVWITWCDQVAIHPRTVERLATVSLAHPAAPLVLPTARGLEPYVHLERDITGRIVRVLHRREGDVMPEAGESEMGLFCLSREAYLHHLLAFAKTEQAGAATGERNFLPFIPWMASRGEVVTFPCVDQMEAVGINTPEDLQLIERYLERRDAGRSR